MYVCLDKLCIHKSRYYISNSEVQYKILNYIIHDVESSINTNKFVEDLLTK